ncbi:hypothetical protein EGW08_003294 [Elysia chlorotica]|uniref:IGFBP N-terminal domain-containing protein n=1 Tax=Elysia chlorotica TaxID=188477 RepID=A0A433U5K4_ELYCH|nr:hypothetical protein EGW08_003294 [Elysia chlorotica]
MKSFLVCIAIVLLVNGADSTPCAELCNTQCTIQEKTCGFTPLFGSLCSTLSGACKMACAAACGCVDGCATKCGDGFSTCKASSSGVAGIFNVFQCGLDLSVCSTTCLPQCNFNLLAGVVQSLGGSSSGGSTDTTSDSTASDSSATTKTK